MKKLLLLLIVLPHFIQAQNLVPNPSFEELNICPSGIAIGTNDFGAYLKYWKGIFGTPDVFNKCNTASYAAERSSCQIPLHWNMGRSFQYPRTGAGYAGILIHAGEKFNNSEPIQVKLTQPLKKGIIYEVSYFINMSDASGFTTRELGLHLSKSSIKTNVYGRFENISPQIRPQKNVEDTSAWEKIHALYIATGGEEWLTLGRFDTTAFPADIRYTKYNQDFPHIAYYYIDDVSVVEYTGIHTVIPDSTICAGDTVTLTAIAYSSFYWSSNATGIDTLSTDSIYKTVPVQDTWYYLVTSFHIDSLLIKVMQGLDFYLVSDTTKCFSDSIIISPVTSHNYQWWWNTTPSLKEFSTSQAGINTLTAKDGRCALTKKVTVHDFPSLHPLLNPDTALCFEENQFIALDAVQANDYIWEPSGERTQQVYVTQAGIFSVTAVDTFGCRYVDSIIISDICTYPVYVPTAFTPNGDGLNDLFSIDRAHILSVEMTIYDRWGEQVFKEHHSNPAWDGTYKNEPLPDGSYFYIIMVQDISGRRTNFSGQVNLIR